MSAFMEPQYYAARPVIVACTRCSREETLPDFAADYVEVCEDCGATDLRFNRRARTEHIFARLSAPGYLDCTEWQGPYPNVFRAARDLCRTFGVHPRTGEPLDY